MRVNRVSPVSETGRTPVRGRRGWLFDPLGHQCGLADCHVADQCRAGELTRHTGDPHGPVRRPAQTVGGCRLSPDAAAMRGQRHRQGPVEDLADNEVIEVGTAKFNSRVAALLPTGSTSRSLRSCPPDPLPGSLRPAHRIRHHQRGRRESQLRSVAAPVGPGPVTRWRNAWIDPDETLLVSTVRAFIDREVKPAVRELEHANIYPEAWIEQMKWIGIFGLAIDEQYGGSPVSMPCYVEVTQELAEDG